jgi:hypothetical protein
MAGHTRLDSNRSKVDANGVKLKFAAQHPRRFAVWLAAAVLVAAPVAAGTAAGAENTVDFEEYVGPTDYRRAGRQTITEAARFSGGQILTDARRIYYDPIARAKANVTSIYAARNPVPLTIAFDEPASEISMQVMNRRADGLIEFTDDSGNSYRVFLNAYFRAGSVATITLPFSNVRKLTVRAPSHRFSFFERWDFAVDNVSFKTDGGEYNVNFSAFVPHNNMPAGPTASCLSKGDVASDGCLPPGLGRRGWGPSSSAIWNRGGGFAPGNGKGRGKGLLGRFPNSFGAPDDELPGNNRKLYFAGDDRDFHPAAPSYRLRQLVTVIADEELDVDGLQDGSIQNLAGEVRAYAEDAMADGVIDEADEDGVAGDCRLFHRAHLTETDLMDVTVNRTGPHAVEIRFAGTLDSPLVGLAQVLGAIDWDFTLTLDDSVEPGVWTLSGAHDGFPAYEIYVNGATVYHHDPGAPPYDFANHIRKLLPPLDVEVMEISGDLP